MMHTRNQSVTETGLCFYFNACNIRGLHTKTKHQLLLLLFLAASIEVFSQAEIQNPVFPFWKIKGNSGTTVGTNFLGTTDAQALMFKVNNQTAGYIDYATPFSTGFGYQTLNVNTGINNAAFGYQALLSNTTANNNTAVGYFSLKSNTTGNANTAVGTGVLQSNVTGANNSAVGYQALVSNTTGISNTAMGFWSMRNNTTGYQNSAFGVNASEFNTTGYNNAAFGHGALQNATTAYGNTAIGYHALFTNTTGSSNTALGHGADVTTNSLTNATAIGYNAKVGASNSLVLGGTGADAVNVGIGTTTPDRPLTVQGTGVNNELISLKNSAGTTKYHWNLASGGLNLAESGVADGRIYVKDATGNVGIGTTTPVELLEVGKNGSDNYIRVDAGSSNANSTGLKLYEFGFNFGWNMRFDANDDDLYFEHNNSGTITNIMKLDNWGNIGIGTTTPAQKLDVAGKIQMQTGAAVGYVPVSDANGTMTWTDPASLSITETVPQVSSATANYIPKWNGTTLVDGCL
ncbi:MAG: hypothetical protein IPH78_10540 [Bacteroidetes bacterium]|nr:hypothetical protein [Bacteroidota bacterium]